MTQRQFIIPEPAITITQLILVALQLTMIMYKCWFVASTNSVIVQPAVVDELLLLIVHCQLLPVVATKE
jgi:hypothetical protein